MKVLKLVKTIGYLTLICNLISCILMTLVLRLVKKVSGRVTYGTSDVQTQLKTNQFVTISHILLITIYSVFSVLFFNVKLGNKVSFYRI